jgi:hypothetical protein
MAVLAFAVVPACGVTHEPSLVTTIDDPLEANNGENLNGENLNGENLNGENLNGENLNGPNPGVFTIWTSLEGVTLNGVAMDSTSLAASVFGGTIGAASYSGTDFAGAQFTAMRGNNVPVTLRIVSVVPPATGDVWNYFVEYYDQDDDEWYAICHDPSGPIAAIPLNGTWDHHFGTPTGGSHTDDPTKFTFACRRKGALAKCVDDGYRPWASHGDAPLAPYHQACVRMIRADYCGDGISYTTNGRLVNLYDNLGIQTDTNPWNVEAEWMPSGARCLTTHRRASRPVSCYDPSLDASCGDLVHFTTGTLIINEIP